MNIDQLTDDLAQVASHLELRPGSAAAAKAEGRRRRYRRRRTGVAVTAVAAVGISGVAIQQLSRPRPTVSSTSDTVAPAAAAAPTAAGAPTTTSAPAGAPLETLPVTLVESPFVWRRIDPDSATAVGSLYDADYRRLTAPIPGVVVSTGPGRGEPVRTLWGSPDGITWAQVGALPTGATAATATTRGDRVYVIGTMPGPTPDAAPAVRVSISDDLGGTWRAADLDLTDPQLEAVSAGFPIRTGISSVAATDTVTVALVRQTLDVGDVNALLDSLGLDYDIVQPAPGGVAVGPCAATPGPADDPAASTTLASTDTPGCSVDMDDLTVIPFADLGTTGATLQAAMQPRQRLFVSDDDTTFREVSMPDVGTTYDITIVPAGNQLLMTSVNNVDGRMTYLQSTDGTAWEPLGGPPNPGRIGAFRDGLVSVPDVGIPAVDIDTDGTGTWRRADLTPLIDDGDMLGLYTSTSSAAGFTAAAIVAEPNPNYEPSDVVATTNVITVPPDQQGGDDPAGVPTTVAPESPYTEQRFEIVHTTDGTSWSRESVADLAGVDASQISTVSRIQHSDAGAVIVAVNLKVADDEIPQQLILIGTPRG